MAAPFDPYEHVDPGAPSRYVIVGCGFSAVLNHLTLRQTAYGRERIGSRPVLHVGHDNPWSHYRAHEMGQYPHLLELPGYSHGFSSADPNRGLPSERFAQATDGELAALVQAGGFDQTLGPYLKAWVALIQPKANPVSRDFLAAIGTLRDDLEIAVPPVDPYPAHAPPYRLLVVIEDERGEPRCEFVYADKIDLCLGSGVPRLLDRRAFGGDERGWNDYSLADRPWQPVENTAPRSVLPAHHALYRNAWPPSTEDTRICLYGTGGISLNLVEAWDGAGWLDWMASTVHLRWTCERNNLRGFVDPNSPGNTSQCLQPDHRRVRFGEWVRIESCSYGLTTFGARRWDPLRDAPREQLCNKTEDCQVRDYWNRTVPLNGAGVFPYHPHTTSPRNEERYDRVLVSLAHRSDKDVPGSVESITRAFQAWNAHRSHDGRMTALRCAGRDEDDVRILGAAAFAVSPVLLASHEDRAAKGAAVQYFETLPLQARPGAVVSPPAQPDEQRTVNAVTFNAVSVALANGYFDRDRLNRNVNTASSDELALLLGDRELAEEIVDLRLESQFGFRNRAELEARLAPRRGASGDWRERLDALRYGYATSG